MSLWFRRSYERVLQRDTNVGTGTLALEAAQAAAQRGVRVYTVGLGSPN